MKKSFIVMIAVLVVSAFMISCYPEPRPTSDGRLVSVNVDYPDNSRSLVASSTLTTDIEDLYWYYTAEKDDGSMFITGQQKEKKLIDSYKDAPGKSRGLWLADLGLFSTGAWRFSFYGYFPVDDDPPADLSEVQPAYQCVSLPVVITEDTSITVTLQAGAGLKNAYLEFGDLTWSYEGAAEQEGTELMLKIHDGEQGSVIASGTAIIDENGEVVFTGISESPTLSPGLHMLVFDVSSPTEEVGLAYVPVYVTNGSAINISGDIENLDVQSSAWVGNTIFIYKELSYTITSTDAFDDIEVKFHFSPDLTNRKTEVEFPEGSVHRTTDSEGNTTTSTLYYTVLRKTEFADAVAAFRLELVKTTRDRDGILIGEESSNEFDSWVEVETRVGKWLGNVTVKDGDGNVMHGIKYENSSGKLEFKTLVLTEFFVYAE